MCGGVVAARLLRLNRSPCRGERCCWCTCSSLVTLFSRRCVMHSRHTLWASFPFTLLFFFSCLCSCFQLMPPHLPVCRSTRRWKKKLAGSDQTTLYLFLCCPHVWEQSTYVARLGFRYSQCHGCFLKNLMCWVPFVCVFQNTCAQNIRGLRAANHLLPELASLRNLNVIST